MGPGEWGTWDRGNGVHGAGGWGVWGRGVGYMGPGVGFMGPGCLTRADRSDWVMRGMFGPETGLTEQGLCRDGSRIRGVTQPGQGRGVQPGTPTP